MKILPLLLLSVVYACAAPQNLVPNPDFAAANPLEGWRVSFPYEPWYTENATYVKPGDKPSLNGGRSVMIDLPPGIAGNQGGKIESAFIPAEPGATYRVSVDCLTGSFSAKLHVEAWALDPKPVEKPDKFRVPPRDGHPALVMCYRAQMPDPPPASPQWQKVEREFTLPQSVKVSGIDEPPLYLSVKAVVYAATRSGGTSYFANFRLEKIR